jgi:Putative zinc-finger
MTASDFRDTLLELIETSPQPMDHPSADQWIAYQRGQLSADEEARFQEHLVRCRDCFDLAEAAASFAEPSTGPDTGTKAGQDVETAALWRLLRPQLDPPDNVRSISAGPRRPSSKPRLPTLLAASFFVALVGMTAWNLRLQSAFDAIHAPQPNALVFDLSAGERAAAPASAEKTLSADTRMLVVHPPGGLPLYRLALHDAATGRELWSYAMKPDEDFALTLALPTGLRPGHYRLELSDGDGKKVLETYRLLVTEAGRGG